MNKLILVLVSLVLLAGCENSPTQQYRPAGSNDDAWNISGKYNGFTQEVIIRINEQIAVQGNIPIFSSGVELQGKYNDKKISTSCNTVYRMFDEKLQCIVFVGSERAATLQF